MAHNAPGHRQSNTTIPSTPDGFAIGVGPDNEQYLVPQFMLPALHESFQAYRAKVELGVAHQPIQVPVHSCDVISEGKIVFPADPALNELELLNIHAEIVGIQQELGISYKDASRQHYIAQVERLKASDEAYRAWKNFDERLGDSLASLAERFATADQLRGAVSDDPMN